MVDVRQVRDALRQVRAEAKQSRSDFAGDAGVSRATVYRIEARVPSIKTMLAIVQASGLTLTEFFARIEGVPAQPHAGSDRAVERSTHVNHSLPSPAQKEALSAVAAIVGETIAQSMDRGFDRLLKARKETRTTRRGKT